MCNFWKPIVVSIKFIIFMVVEWLPRYLTSPVSLAWKILTRKKTNPVFILYQFSGNHSDFSYWLASLLVSFTPGTIAVNYDETHLLVHLFDESDQSDVTELLAKFMDAIK